MGLALLPILWVSRQLTAAFGTVSIHLAVILSFLKRSRLYSMWSVDPRVRKEVVWIPGSYKIVFLQEARLIVSYQ
jgi:hypothetical protein